MDPGDTVHCHMSKWGDRPHWRYEGLWLGSDEHGDWIGFRTGTVFTRPGLEFSAKNDQVGLVPAPVDGVRPWWLATFHASGGSAIPDLLGEPVSTYVDMTTPAQWRGDTLHAVDLDLDVVRGLSGRVVVDDEDEFAEHQIAFGYPADVVDAARASCEWVHAAVSQARAPFDGSSHLPWLERLSATPTSTAP